MKGSGMFEIGNMVVAIKESQSGFFRKGAVGVITSVAKNSIESVTYEILFTDGDFVRYGNNSWWAYPREIELLYSEKARKEWSAMTMEEVENIISKLPGGIEGFLKGWGWMHFAREVEKLCQEKNS